MIEWWGPIFVEAYGATEWARRRSRPRSGSHIRAPSGAPSRRSRPSSSTTTGTSSPTGRAALLPDTTGRGIVYHNDPEKTAAAHIATRRVHVGEIGYVDEDGYVYITDRSSDMVVSGGVNIYPAEAERSCSSIRAWGRRMFGVPHQEMGEELQALVVPVDPSSPADAGRADQRLPRPAGALQVPTVDRVRRRPSAASDGQGQQAILRAPYWKRADASQQ